MKQLAVGAALSAIAMFLWGFVYWAATPLPYRAVMKVVPDELVAGQRLKELLPETGVYLIPSPASGASPEELNRRQQAGPAALVIFNRDGVAVGPGTFLGGLVHYFVSALIAGLFLVAALPAVPTYAARARLVFLAGLAGSVFSDLGKPIWWHYPWSYSCLDFGYDATIWLIGAVILARCVRGRG